MRLSLSINLGNDAMQTTDDIAAVLRDVASTIRSQGIVFEQRRTIRDVNGNSVGEWELRGER